ncbi:MAG: universal stress protein [Deltaproteobacteria bacterium]|nr:universal stress protein [Deltaproteobacteria bacterium]
MDEFKKILFPVDLSESSAKIVPYVLMTAKHFEAEIHLLFVARVLEYFRGIYVPQPSITKFQSEIVGGAKTRLAEFKDEYFLGVSNVETSVLTGDIADEILKYISREKIDLVIMGTHGRKGLEKVVFGSVAERVVQLAPVPIMMVNPHRIKS